MPEDKEIAKDKEVAETEDSHYRIQHTIVESAAAQIKRIVDAEVQRYVVIIISALPACITYEYLRLRYACLICRCRYVSSEEFKTIVETGESISPPTAAPALFGLDKSYRCLVDSTVKRRALQKAMESVCDSIESDRHSQQLYLPLGASQTLPDKKADNP